MGFDVQFVCFYYVLTTFTTVGYGENLITFHIRPCNQLISNRVVRYMAGDIYATTDAERVLLPWLALILPHLAPDMVNAGVLYLSVPGCCLSVWHHRIPN